MLDSLRAAGFQVEFHAHAEAILGVDFPGVARQLEAILAGATIPIEEIVGSGGGETKGTQRLRRALHEHGWRKHKFEIQRIIDGVQAESTSHEVDHIARFPAGVVALRSSGTIRTRSSTAIWKTTSVCTRMVPSRLAW